MVGAVRFELTTSCTPSKRASQATLRPEPLNCINSDCNGPEQADSPQRFAATFVRSFDLQKWNGTNNAVFATPGSFESRDNGMAEPTQIFLHSREIFAKIAS
jgi:hypothetical protein